MGGRGHRWHQNAARRITASMAASDIPKRAVPKIQQLVADAKAALQRLGIDTKGKRPEEILRMAREERNRPKPK
jgi:hypothetical protein